MKRKIIYNKKLSTENIKKYIIKSGITIKANEDTRIFNDTFNYSTRHTISNNTQGKKKSLNKPTQLFNRRFILYNLEITPRKITVIAKEYNIKTTHRYNYKRKI